MGNPQGKIKYKINNFEIAYSKHVCAWLVKQGGITLFSGTKYDAKKFAKHLKNQNNPQ